MATIQQVEAALRRHAILSVSIERARAIGQKISREAAMECQRIEADINSILPPSAADAVAAFQEQVKSDLLRMEAQGYGEALGEQHVLAQARLDVLRDRGARNATANIHNGEGGLGLNAQQMGAALSKGKFKTIPREHARKQYEREVAVESGGTIDPKKFMAAWTRAYDAPAGSPTRERFLDSIGAKGDRSDRARFFDALSADMLQTELDTRSDDRALKEDKIAFKAREHTVSPHEARRLDVTAAMLKHPESFGALSDRVSEQSLNDKSGTGMRSDIAHAVADHSGQRDYADVATELSDLHDLATSDTLV